MTSNARSVRPRLVAPLALALLFPLAGCDSGARDRFMSIGTGGTGGVYYVLGGAIASRLNQQDPERQYTAEVTGASVENINRVREGQLDLGIVMSISAYEAYYGGMDYPTPVENIRVVAPLYPNITHVLVSRNSPVATLADMRGRRVSVGSPGSGTEQVSRQLLEAVGLTYNDVDARYLSFTETAAALQDGAIDAAIISVGYPAADPPRSMKNPRITTRPMASVSAPGKIMVHAAMPSSTCSHHRSRRRANPMVAAASAITPMVPDATASAISSTLPFSSSAGP
jgi:TRAP transporter TAXI family solute receptor